MDQLDRELTRTHGGNAWDLMRHRGLSRDQVIDFSVDVNPFGFPASVRAAVLEHVDDLQRYPDPDAVELRETIATSHRIPAAAVLPGNGSAELISLLGRLPQVNRCLIIAPTFGEYEWTLAHAGVAVALAETTEAAQFRVEWSPAQWARLLAGVDLVFLCNPNNPTGVALVKADVVEIARRCRDAGARLVVDEAFVEFVEQPDAVSVLPEALAADHLIVLRSLTKLFAVPGLRLGYLVAPPALVDALRARQPAWPLNTFASAVGVRLLGEADYVVRSRQAIIALRGELQRWLGALPGLRPFPSAANFVLCQLTEARITSSELCARLAAQGLLLRNCDSFTGLEPDRFIRIAVRTQAENARLVSALREVLRHAG